MAPAVKRMIAHLFLVWLAGNLKLIPVLPAHRQKATPRRPLSGSATLPTACTVAAATTAAFVQQRERLCPTRALLCAACRRPWHGT
jgi:hypothetical protein